MRKAMGGQTCWILYGTFLTVTAWLTQVQGSELRDLKVQCSRSGLTVHVVFDQPFHGIIYSKDFYEVPKCTYVTPIHNGRTKFSFSVPLKGCGTVSHLSSGSVNSIASHRSLDGQEDVFLENTIVIQRDPDIQEAGDTARRLRCVWRNTLQKSVNAKLTEVYQPSLMTVFLDNNSVDKLVDIQKTRGPLTQPALGFISSLPTFSSMAIYLKDSSKRFDANVLNCIHTNGRGEKVNLTDDDGCTTRPDLITPFYKTRENANPNSDVTIYSYFRGFRVPHDSSFSISCTIEICFPRCADRCRHLYH